MNKILVSIKKLPRVFALAPRAKAGAEGTLATTFNHGVAGKALETCFTQPTWLAIFSPSISLALDSVE